MKTLFFDTEVEPETGRICDLGAVRSDAAEFHSPSLSKFSEFAKGCDFICGHNALDHDLKYVSSNLRAVGVDPASCIDTLHLSALLFPKKPYHRLVKDEKLLSDELNNPRNDAIKARDLFYDEVAAWRKLPSEIAHIYHGLLSATREFGAFFRWLKASGEGGGGFAPVQAQQIVRVFEKKICLHAPIGALMTGQPIELAYALALISTDDSLSVFPRWVNYAFPGVEQVLRQLRGVACSEGCDFCRAHLDAKQALKRWFGFDSFRTFAGESLQEDAVVPRLEGGRCLSYFPRVAESR